MVIEEFVCLILLLYFFRTRKNAKARAAELMQLGKHEEARNYLRRCVDITHGMALCLIQECRAKNVDCIVAPYEADGQLAYLNAIGVADYVITEDSDLILFGCKKILFKLDLTGSCLFVDASKLHLAMGCTAERFTFEKFRFMCIMSGCDYLDSLPGIGLAKSCKFVLKTEEDDVWRALSKIPSYLNMRQLEVTEEYKESFLKANATFQHMIVFDPRTRKLVHLNDPVKAGTDLRYCSNAGEFFDETMAFQLALGNVDPFTLKKLDDWSPDDRPTLDKGSHVAKHRSMWQSPENTTKATTASAKPTTRNNNNSVRQFIKFRDAPVQEPTTTTTTTTEDDTSDDLLSVYGRSATISQPSAKRSKHFHFDPLETTPNLARNPFGVSTKVHSPTFTSPTKISASNRSLILQCSPVKRIEYSTTTNQTSPVKKRLDTKFGGAKLRLKQTVLDEKQKVLSRFFQANANLVAAKQEATAVTVADQVADLERLVEERQENAMYSDAEVRIPTASTSSSNEAEEENEMENNPQTVDFVDLDDIPDKCPSVKSPKCKQSKVS